MKAEGHLGRYYLKGRAGDAANVILSAVGYNLRLVLAWLRIILRGILLALLQTFTIRPASNPLLNGRPTTASVTLLLYGCSSTSLLKDMPAMLAGGTLRALPTLLPFSFLPSRLLAST